VEFYPMKYTYFRWRSTRLAIEWQDAANCTGCLAALSTMLYTILNTMPYLFEVTLPRILSRIRSWYRLRIPSLYNYNGNWQMQLMTINWLLNQSLPPMFPMKLYEISCQRSNDFPMSGMTILESQTTSVATNYRPGSAGMKHHQTH